LRHASLHAPDLWRNTGTVSIVVKFSAGTAAPSSAINSIDNKTTPGIDLWLGRPTECCENMIARNRSRSAGFVQRLSRG
jgi:hypothetical protein